MVRSGVVTDLFAVRSVLFLPASNPRAIAKARESAAGIWWCSTLRMR